MIISLAPKILPVILCFSERLTTTTVAVQNAMIETDSDEIASEVIANAINDDENEELHGSAVILNQDVTRGGVKVETGRDLNSGYIISRLSLANAQVTDIGNYTCRLTSWPKSNPNMRSLHDTISLHVLQGENTEAIQEASGGSFVHSSVTNLMTCSFPNLEDIWIFYCLPFSLLHWGITNVHLEL